jgi:uncharacterized SAM-binding protein YcdF (DUF218 family)
VLILCLGLVALGALGVGFLRFADTVTKLRPPFPLAADGIVVLTGGTDRIAGAVELMASGKARRLLVSGVHPGTSDASIRRLGDADPALMACCIDLDRRAANTVGNAIETAKWTRRNGFLSLIVVTSAYHMPRAMLELGAAMPGIRLIPYPITSVDLSIDRWGSHRGVPVLLVEEYVKYAATRLRLALVGIDGLSDLVVDISG